MTVSLPCVVSLGELDRVLSFLLLVTRSPYEQFFLYTTSDLPFNTLAIFPFNLMPSSSAQVWYFEPSFFTFPPVLNI